MINGEIHSEIHYVMYTHALCPMTLENHDMILQRTRIEQLKQV